MYFNKNTLVFHNGEWQKAEDATTSLYAQTLHYGNGVFEGIRAYRNNVGFNVFKAREHYERLHRSAGLMHLEVPYSVEELVNITYELLSLNNLTDAYIRPLVYLGSNMTMDPSEDVNIFIAAWKWEKYLGDKAAKAKISSYRRISPSAHHVEAKAVGHYTNSILANTEAKRAGFDAAILLDQQGYIAEASVANLFIEKDGELFTPPKGHILPGITRATVLEICKELEVKVTEKTITPTQLLEADAAFLTGTATELVPLAQVEDTVYPIQWEDSIGYNLQQAYRQKVLFNDLQTQTII